LVTGVLGGYLSQLGMEYEAFLLCAMLALITLMMAWRFVDEEPRSPSESFGETWQALRSAGRSPVLLSVATFLFLWSLDPLSTTVVYVHITETLGWSEQFFGYTLSLLAVGCILGSIGYGFYCRAVSMRLLTHLAISLGALSQAAYWTMDSKPAAVFVHILVGVTWMTASLIQLDLAARVCPPKAAATIFAVLMALTNFASSLGEWIGGYTYDLLLRDIGSGGAFAIMVGAGTAIKISCWLLMLLPGRWSEGRVPGRQS
jgi:predicted MFS family arabinose efflux permease